MNKQDNESTNRISEESDIDRVKLGMRLREARQYINLSQDAVAQHVGISRTALSQFENGRRKFDALVLKKIAELYKQPVSYFTGEISFAEDAARDIAHLATSVEELSEHDRAELSRFAEYLHARAQTLRTE